MTKYSWLATFYIEGLELEKNSWENSGFEFSKLPPLRDEIKKLNNNDLKRISKIFPRNLTFCKYYFETDSIDPTPDIIAEEKISSFLNTLVLSSVSTFDTPGKIKFFDLKVHCINLKEIQKQGLPEFTIFKGEFTSYYRRTNEELNHIINQISIYEGLPQKELIDQLTLFYRNASTSEDEYGCFMSLFIGFNALYNRIGPSEPDDGKKIEKVVDFIIRNGYNRAQDIIKQFTTHTPSAVNLMTLGLGDYGYENIFDGLTKENLDHSNTLQNAINSNNYRLILWKSLLCIKDIRHKIFHGHYSVQELGNKRIFIAICSIFLGYILKLSINCLIHELKLGHSI